MAGTATEKTLRDILAELESDTLPTDAATETTLAKILTAVELIDDLRNALDSVGTDELDVNVEDSVLPTGAATETTLASILTAVQLIDDLRGALDSVDTDELVVNVDESALPTGAATSANQQPITGVVEENVTDETLSGGSNNLDGTAVGAGKMWRVTAIACMYSGTAPTSMRVQIAGLASGIRVIDEWSVTSGQHYMWAGELYMQEDDYVRLHIEGATLNDDAYLYYAGVEMDAP